MRLSVLLPTHNGAAFLRAQLDSIAAQTRPPDLLVISDDGSRDATCAMARAFARTAPFEVVVRRHTKARGLAANMRDLLAHCPAGYVALADQDDVWLPQKLARACQRLEAVHTPALYAARRMVTNCELRPLGLTRLPRLQPRFDRALRRNIAPGNTLVLNPAARDIAHTGAQMPSPLPAFHDWWLYQLVTGAGGAVIFDPEPVLLYRQHGKNLFGAGLGITARSQRVRMRLDGTYRGWLRAQCSTLDAQRTLLLPQAQAQLDRFMLRRGMC